VVSLCRGKLVSWVDMALACAAPIAPIREDLRKSALFDFRRPPATDANPMLNLSSFVTTFCEPEAKDIYDASMFRNFADPDMYPHTKETEFKCVQWLHDLWNDLDTGRGARF
jgi:glutamate/tyrosine decarboxylase-like PLP-dependent enzyme